MATLRSPNVIPWPHNQWCFHRRLSDAPPATDKLIYPSASTTNHHDLASFLDYAKRTGLDKKSTVYVGTHYEYSVAATLARYGFQLKRVGGAGDFGTDLLGTWTIPTASKEPKSAPTPVHPRVMRVLMQCKAGAAQKTGPQHIRELEGALAAAPPGWRGEGTLAILVSQKPATKGVRDAVGRSRWPMGFVACSKDGKVLQMLWNRGAEEGGLQGVGVTVRHGGEDEDGVPELVLQMDGRTLPMVSGT
ncbi:restriction endonuclease domain-containing protein [Sarocladium implicatum]|nr:restriction endonuclease domain-containing protein [Sarocladium implicatum]